MRRLTGELRPTDLLYEEYRTERERAQWGEQVLELADGWVDEGEELPKAEEVWDVCKARQQAASGAALFGRRCLLPAAFCCMLTPAAVDACFLCRMS